MSDLDHLLKASMSLLEVCDILKNPFSLVCSCVHLFYCRFFPSLNLVALQVYQTTVTRVRITIAMVHAVLVLLLA